MCSVVEDLAPHEADQANDDERSQEFGARRQAVDSYEGEHGQHWEDDAQYDHFSDC